MCCAILLGKVKITKKSDKGLDADSDEGKKLFRIADWNEIPRSKDWKEVNQEVVIGSKDDLRKNNIRIGYYGCYKPRDECCRRDL
jgi:hypothetical protein